MRMTLKSSLFKYERKKSGFVWFSLNLKEIFFFYFNNPHLRKYLNLNTQNQPLMRDDETSTVTSDEAKTIWAEANKNSLS